ncbi:MAG: leucine-rich repeat domain-containing protein [Clostridia bacterium]|nr:leucine-rich repeat domain-containing protein [Clostridia bacterium]
MRKWIVGIVLALTLVLTLAGCNQAPESEERADLADFEYIEENDTITITGLKDLEKKTLTVPEDVTHIGRGAFSWSKMEEITLPSTLVSIEEIAFSDCENLKKIQIPESVTYIGAYAFRGCTSLEDYNIPKAITTIPRGAFSGCDSLTKIEIPAHVTAIGDSAFGNCKNVTEVLIHTNVTQIGNYSFSGCEALCVLTIPKSVTVINEGLINGTGIKKMIIPKTITEIVTDAFSYCKGATIYFEAQDQSQITLHENWNSANCPVVFGITPNNTVIVDNLQYFINGEVAEVVGYAEEAKTVTIPETIKIEEKSYPVSKINPFVFRENRVLESIALPDTITFIEDEAFINCSELTTIVASVEKIGERAFYGCERLVNIPSFAGASEIGQSAFEKCISLTQIDISSLEIIPKRLFQGCEALKTVTLGQGLVEIQEEAFRECIVLTDVSLPNGLVSIGKLAFLACSSITKIDLPNSIQSLNDPFSACTGIEEIVIPSQLSQIEMCSFRTSTNLKRLTTPTEHLDKFTLTCVENVIINGGEEIPKNTFNGCSSLKEITLSSTITKIGESAFANCVEISNIEFPPHLTQIESNALQNCSKIEKIVVPSSVIKIGKGAFSGCAGIKELTLPFIGEEVKAPTDPSQYPLGYIFGEEAYEGGTLTKQPYKNEYGKNSEFQAYIPNGLTKVIVVGGDILGGAFANCSYLEEVILPQTTTQIGENAFLRCSQIKSLDIPTGTTKIDSWAFGRCTGLEQITLPDTVTSIGERAFLYCEKLTEIQLPSQLKEIGTGAFCYCSSFSEIYVPSSVESIGAYAFASCTALEKITLPFVGNSVKQVSDSTQYPFGFVFDTNGLNNQICTEQSYIYNGRVVTDKYYLPSTLKSVTITGGNILQGAFSGCGSLTEIILPNDITSIGKEAFADCTGIEKIEIPSGVESLGAGVFKNCTGLKKIDVPSGVSVIKEESFYNCTALTEVLLSPSTSKIYDYAFYNCDFNSISLNEGLVEIGEYVFSDTGIVSIKLPSSLATIVSTSFNGCSLLEEVIVDGNNLTFTIENGALIKGERIVLYPQGRKNELFTLPTGITTIDDYAFEDNPYLKNVTLGTDLATIGMSAFKNCTSIEELTLNGDNVTIGNEAFYGTTKLAKINYNIAYGSVHGGMENDNRIFYGTGANTEGTALVIGATVKEIPNYLFRPEYQQSENTPKLTSVIFEEGSVCTRIDEYAFAGVSGIKSLSLPQNLSYVEEGAFLDCTGLESVSFGALVHSIGKSAFKNCTSLAQLSTPEGVIAFSDYAFYNCTNLKGVSLPSENTTIGSYAFAECKSLENVEIAEGVAEFGANSFENCTSLLKVSANGYVSNKNSIICDNSFSGCTKLKEFSLVEIIDKIGAYAFANCNSLTTLEADKTYEIKDYAFLNCTSMEDLDINGVISVGNYAFKGCTALKEYTVSSNFTSVGQGILSGCYNIEKLNIYYVDSSDDLKTKYLGYLFGEEAYAGSTKTLQCYDDDEDDPLYYSFYIPEKLTTVVYGIATVPNYYFENCSNIKNVTLDGTTRINDYAFSNCTGLENIDLGTSLDSIQEFAFSKVGLKTITIPSTTTLIMYEAFSQSSIESILVDEANETYYSVDGVLFEVSDSSLVRFPPMKNVNTYTVPNGTKRIDVYSFADNKFIMYVNVPGTVTAIDSYAFLSCSNLLSISLTEGLERIESDAFQNCTELRGIDFPSTTNVLGNNVFWGCYNISTIAIPSTLTSVSPNALVGCFGLTEFYVSQDHPYLCSIDGVVFNKEVTILNAYPPSKPNREYTIPSTVTTIASDAFRGSKKLEEITIGDSVKTIGPYAFSYCTNLKTVYIGIGIEDILPYAFLEAGVEKLYYAGTKVQWVVDVSCGELELERAEKIFNYKKKD